MRQNDMRRSPSLFCALILAAVSACTGFEHNETLVSPSAPSLPSLPTGGGSLTGTWLSTVPITVPSSWSCGEFQWSITSQTPTSLAGKFYAICAGIVLVQGQSNGQLNGGTEVALHLTGTASVQSVISCSFDLNGTGFIEGQDAIRIHYEGSTCFGPLHGDETLRRPAPDAPPPPPPAPPEPEPVTPPAPPTNPYHVGPGPLDFDRAERVVRATANEYPNLTAPPSSEQEGVARAEELLLRVIWHLKLAGYDAARQRNPSGAISNDKLNVLIFGAWNAYDIFQDLGRPGVPIRVIFLPIEGENPVPYPGIPD
jgi:hypothetical protein